MNLKYVNCNNCGANDYRVICPSTVGDAPPVAYDFVSTAPNYGKYHDIVRCNRCGFIYMNPRDADIASLYKDAVDEEYINSWDERIITFGALLRKVMKYKKSGRVLDVGTYGGIFLEAAIGAGYQVMGIEPSTWAVNYAKEKTGADVIQGTCESAELGDRKFDLITMWDVVEHLEDPAACLKKLRSRLEDDGMLVVTTHDISSLLARLLGKKYMWLMRFHLSHFSPKTLEDMLKRAGYEQIGTWRFPKHFSLRYLIGRFGIKSESALLQKIVIPVSLGDFFCSVFRKKV